MSKFYSDGDYFDKGYWNLVQGYINILFCSKFLLVCFSLQYKDENETIFPAFPIFMELGWSVEE